MLQYIDIRTNPGYKFDEVLGIINYNFSQLTGVTSALTTGAYLALSGGTVSGTTIFSGNGSNEILVIRNPDTYPSGQDNLQVFDGSGTKQIYIDNSYQLAWNAGVNGPIYFGAFANPSAGLAGFSVPGEVINAVSATYKRFGYGGGGVYYAVTDPKSLVEIRGKADEIQLIVQANATQNENLIEVRDASENPFLVVDAIGRLSASTISANTLSAGTIYSGSTNLYDIFVTSVDGNDITRVQPGVNTYTGGTGNYPTINVSAATLDNIIVSGDSSFQGVTATTLSATTISAATAAIQGSLYLNDDINLGANPDLVISTIYNARAIWHDNNTNASWYAHTQAFAGGAGYGNFGIGTSSNNANNFLTISTGGTTNITRLGINTNTAIERLSVNGNGYINGGLTANTFSSSTITATTVFANSFTANTNGGYYGYDAIGVARQLATFTGDNIRIIGRPGVSDIYLDPTSGTSLGMYIKGSNGSVGIGMATPTAKLHLSGFAGSTIFRITNSGGNSAFVMDNGDLKAQFYGGGGLDYPSVTSTASNQIGVGFSNTSVALITASIAHLIVSGGSVGIGIGSFNPPLAKLDVSGNTLFRSNSVTGFTIYNSTGVTPTFIVNTSANTVGNVGIRVSNPSLPFEVSGGSNSHIVGKFWGDSNRGASAQFTRAGSYDWSIGTGGATGVVPASSFGIYDTTAAALRMIFTHTNGLVGINTSAPRERLEVAGNIYSSGAITATTITATTMLMSAMTASSNSISGFSVVNLSANTPVLTVNTINNRVGIVNGSPATSLDVGGAINALSSIGQTGGYYIGTNQVLEQGPAGYSNGAMVFGTRANTFQNTFTEMPFGIATSGTTLKNLFTIAQAVAGYGRVSSTSGLTTITGANTSFLSFFNTGDTITFASNTYTISSITNDSIIVLTTTAVTTSSSVSYTTAAAGDRFYVGANGNIKSMSNSISGLTVWAKTGTTPVLTVDTANFRVGINTDAPAYKWHLKNGSAGSVSLIGGTNAAIENSTTNYLTFIQPDANLGGITWGSPSDPFGAYVRWGFTQNQLDISTSTSGGILNFMAGSDVPVMTMTSTQINLLTNNIQRGVLNSTGKFGLGTITPMEQLHVTGNTLIGGGLTGSSAVISGSTRIADGILFVSRLQDVNLSMISVNAGTANLNAFQLNVDQPNLKSNLDARAGYSLGFQISDAEKALLTSSNFQVLVPISASTISATTLSILGAGSTSATTAVTITNSSGTNLLTINNSGQTNFGNYATPATQRSFTFGQESAFMSMGSITNSPSAFGIYANQTSPSNSNFSLNLTSTNTNINAPSSTVNLQVAAGTRYAITNTTHTWTSGQMASSSGVNFSFTAPFATSSPSGTNISKFSIILNTNQWSTGAIPAQDFVSISQPSALFVGASTATTISTFSILGAPSASTNSTLDLTTAFLIKPGVVSGPGTAITSFGAYINSQSGALTNYALGVNGDVIITGNTLISNILTASTIVNGSQSIAGFQTNLTGMTKISGLTVAGQFIDFDGTQTNAYLRNTAGNLRLANGGSGADIIFDSNGVNSATFRVRNTDLQFSNGFNVTISTGATGTKIGTADSQLFAFWNATPIVQPVSGTSLDVVLTNTGLMQSGATYNSFSLPLSASSISASTNIVLNSVGSKIIIATGTNASAGVVILTAGTATVLNTLVTNSSMIFLTPQNYPVGGGGNPVPAVAVSGRTAGVSFTIASSDITDTATIAWHIIEPK